MKLATIRRMMAGEDVSAQARELKLRRTLRGATILEANRGCHAVGRGDDNHFKSSDNFLGSCLQSSTRNTMQRSPSTL
jgi:hypothetical protein